LTSRTSGFPTSGNGASSFHLWWVDAPAGDSVEVSITVEWEPEVDKLCFWALQASFADSNGRRVGGAHLGLQWNPRFPRSRAANWGGYDANGQVLRGTESRFPSAPRDRNTRDYPWEPGREYRLRIVLAEPGWWSGQIAGPGEDFVEIRRLEAGGELLEAPVVWSEIFTRCDDRAVAACWRDPTVERAGSVWHPQSYLVNYQAIDRGGCSNTTVVPAAAGVVQITNSPRLVAQGEHVPVV